MNIEEVAARYARIPGYKLIDYAPAALPLWIIELEALVIGMKKLALVDEFILRSVESEINTPHEVAGFLGLARTYVDRCLGGLLAADHIDYAPAKSGEPAAIRLTKKGEKSVREAMVERPRQEVLTFLYDGITRKLFPAPKNLSQLVRPFQVTQWGLREIPALPGRPPTDGEINEQDLNTALPAVAKKDRKIRQVLSVSKIGQRKQRFREAIVLIFRGNTDEDLLVKFVTLDGRPLPEVDTAFAQRDGANRLRIKEQLVRAREESERIIAEAGASHAVEAAKKMPEEEREKVARAAGEIVRLERQKEEAAKLLKDAESEEENKRLRAELVKLAGEMAAREEILGKQKGRLLEVFEHPRVFDEALKNARQRLMVISPWISDQAVTYRRLEAMQRLLFKGVEVYVGYGISEEWDKRRGGPRDEDTEAFEAFQDFAERYKNMHFVRLGDTHAKVLVKDNDLAVVGSFNWMSFVGTRKKEFREELSVLQTDPTFVEGIFSRYVKRFAERSSRR